MLDHPIILIIILAAALLRWLSQKSATSGPDPERPQVPDEPIPRTRQTETEEERIRRFLEALGQPTTSTPPPKVTRRPTILKREVVMHVPPFKSPLPPLTTAPPPLVSEPPPLPTFPTSTVQPPPPPPIEPRIFQPIVAPERGFEVHDIGTQILSDSLPVDRRSAADQRGFMLKFASVQDLRRAIVLREIFGPPRSLQSSQAEGPLWRGGAI